jgi:hypothetical protein
MAIAGFHAFALLPWYGDGSSICAARKAQS